LQGVDKLRIESGGDLNAHTADKEVEVHDPQITLLVPRNFVLLHHAGDDGVGAMAGVWCFEETHDGGVDVDQRVAVTFAKAWGLRQYLYDPHHIPTPGVYPRHPEDGIG